MTFNLIKHIKTNTTACRAGTLLILDCLAACVATSHGAVDLGSRHGLLTWLTTFLSPARDKVAHLLNISNNY